MNDRRRPPATPDRRLTDVPFEDRDLTDWLLDAGSIVVTVALLVLVTFGVNGLGRILLALAFISYVPGRAVVTNWPDARERSAVALPIALSFALWTVPAVLILWVHVWEPTLLFYLIAVASIGALVVARRRRAAAAAPPPRHPPDRMA